MKKVTQPNVRLLATGEEFVVKQMEARAGDLLPNHRASLESVLVVLEGECVLSLSGTDHSLSEGESFVVPPEIGHQIGVIRDLKAIHVMPKGIRFDFYE